MDRYRIIEVKDPTFTKNTNNVAGFIPDITYDVSYYIDKLYVTKNKWTRQEHEEWRKVSGWYDSVKQAEAMIKLYQAERMETVVKEC
jgi:hypothetical protein